MTGPPSPSGSSATLVLVVRRTIRATPQRLFEAWTDPSQLLRWWGPEGVSCIGAEIDLRVGGRYRIGNEFPNGSVVWLAGAFEVVAPPDELVYTWGVEGRPDPVERVTVRFESRHGSTEVVVIHERIRDDALRSQHQRGWRDCLDGLAEYVES